MKGYLLKKDANMPVQRVKVSHLRMELLTARHLSPYEQRPAEIGSLMTQQHVLSSGYP